MSLGNFLWNHYCTARNAIHVLTVELDTLKSQFQITDTDFETFHQEERCYLGKFKGFPAQDQALIRYVHALDELAEKK